MKVYNVFTNLKGHFGNPVGIIVDEAKKFQPQQRQRISANSGFSETVFIDDIKDCKIEIYNPQGKIDFSGHAILGCAYFFHMLDRRQKHIIIIGDMKVCSKQEDNLTLIETDPKFMPKWNMMEFKTPIEIDERSCQSINAFQHTYAWSWINRDSGLIRARTFAPDWGIPEDKANGSGSVLLCSKLRQNLQIQHGKGSMIFTRYTTPNTVELGGFVKKISD